jgi:acetyl-CoA carboxylase biotin carboxyl carrier protein
VSFSDTSVLDLLGDGIDRVARPLPGHHHLGYEPSMALEISAPITGTVWKVQVGVGDSVTEGQTVIILESMKMEMPVESPDSGKVAEILVTEGQAVEEGDVLVRLA